MPQATFKLETWICSQCPFRWEFTEAAAGASPYDQTVMDANFPGVEAGLCPACFQGLDPRPDTGFPSRIPKRNPLGKDVQLDKLSEANVASEAEIAEQVVQAQDPTTGAVIERALTQAEHDAEVQKADQAATHLAAIAVQEVLA